MKTSLLALSLILAATLWRMGLVFLPSLFNAAPITALVFCGSIYLRDWRLRLTPLAALLLSDLWLNHYHAAQFGYTWSPGEMILRAGCIATALILGRVVARRPNAVNLLSGVLGSSLLFYLTTNTFSWFGDPFYAKTATGWWQALTVGHPQYPPTLWFFRNTLMGDLFFTGLFLVVMHYATAREARTLPQHT
jgi:hypothetical protein